MNIHLNIILGLLRKCFGTSRRFHYNERISYYTGKDLKLSMKRSVANSKHIKFTANSKLSGTL